MSKSVLFSINRPHTIKIISGIKKVELRTKPPKIDGAYKGLIYETKKHGGCGKVIGEFTAYNENTYRVCMGVPAHLALESWMSTADILKYSDNGNKDITAISISDLVIYDEPKSINDFVTMGDCDCDKCGECKWLERGNDYNVEDDCLLPYENNFEKPLKPLFRPPQSWCYVEEL